MHYPESPKVTQGCALNIGKLFLNFNLKLFKTFPYFTLKTGIAGISFGAEHNLFFYWNGLV